MRRYREAISIKFIYGSNDWETLNDGQKNCYLLTNGLGGFSSLTMIGSNARNDHSLLMVCFNKQNKRYHMITNLGETIEINGKRHYLSSQEHVNNVNNKNGFRYLNMFCVDQLPRWLYQVNGVEVRKLIVMPYKRNAIGVKYIISNRTNDTVQFELTPYLQFVDKGSTLKENQQFIVNESSIISNDMILNYATNGLVSTYPQQFIHDLYYSQDSRDGREAIGAVAHNHRITKEIMPGERGELFVIYDIDCIDEKFDIMYDKEVQRTEGLIKKSGLLDKIACQLVISADQFIVEKESIQGKTIIAGYPFFTDWGRDTMIALSGCCIATNRFEDAKSIFRSFIKYCNKGLMPNLFPEGGNQPLYNTVDASLLFINALYEYYEASKDIQFIEEAFEAANDIIGWYIRGTDFHIGMDDDGLIMAGAKDEQVTWMDVRFEDTLPTPRHGKPVEINAYWYSALKIMGQFSEILNRNKEAFESLAEKVKNSFCKQFWNEEKGYLKDLISGTNADMQMRCNQIWAVSVPFSMLDSEKQKKVVNKVYELLYTPYGLRSLEKGDSEFHPKYGGKQYDRDMAYHQGTVWAFPLGAYYLAYLKANANSSEALGDVQEQLLAIESTLREGCVGQIAEIFDGEYPSSSQGCFAQAWSVGEILKVYKYISMYAENVAKR